MIFARLIAIVVDYGIAFPLALLKIGGSCCCFGALRIYLPVIVHLDLFFLYYFEMVKGAVDNLNQDV